jgi:orotate phosphoribosyltransferase
MAPASKSASDRAAANAARRTARNLLAIKAVLCRPEKPFTFTSGRKSPVYVDCRKVIAFPKERDAIVADAVKLIEREIGWDNIDVVAGGETAGIPYAALIAQKVRKPMVYVRKQPKGFGRMAQIEGEIRRGQRALLVEDLATDGGSKHVFIDALRKAGAKVSDVFVVFHYGIFPQSVKSLARKKVRLHALATWWDVVDTGEADGTLTRKTAAQVREFLNDPDGWAKARDLA